MSHTIPGVFTALSSAVQLIGFPYPLGNPRSCLLTSAELPAAGELQDEAV